MVAKHHGGSENSLVVTTLVAALLIYSKQSIPSASMRVGMFCLGKSLRSLKEKLLRSRLTDLHPGQLVLA